jgi:hypothetical protein
MFAHVGVVVGVAIFRSLRTRGDVRLVREEDRPCRDR